MRGSATMKKAYTRVNPHPKKYATNAERQAAYRKRRGDSPAESDRRYLRSRLRYESGWLKRGEKPPIPIPAEFRRGLRCKAYLLNWRAVLARRTRLLSTLRRPFRCNAYPRLGESVTTKDGKQQREIRAWLRKHTGDSPKHDHDDTPSPRSRPTARTRGAR
jgi:hypothetical protein